jgi:hypothetical protein
MARRGRPLVLDDMKRREICAIVGVGCSQNMAAQYVGCSPSTITNQAERDPQFAAKLRQAKCNAELSLVKNIRAAAKKEQYWRAAAWMLERGFPEKYAARSPDVITADQLAKILTNLAKTVTEDVPVANYRKKVVKRFDSVARAFGKTIRKKPKREAADGSK